jgi:prefoldin subunit 5
MALTAQETEQIDEMIRSYKRTIKYIRSQILDLERKKLVVPDIDSKFDFIIIKKEKENETG